MKRPLAMVATLYVAGVLLGEFLPLPWPLLGAGGLALGGLQIVPRRKRLGELALSFALFHGQAS